MGSWSMIINDSLALLFFKQLAAALRYIDEKNSWPVNRK
jgi:hypothetical protein